MNIIKTVTFICVFLAAVSASHAQIGANRSLNKELQRFESLYIRGVQLYRNSEYDKMQLVNKQLLSIAFTQNFDELKVKAYLNVSLYFDGRGEYTSSQEYNYKALNIATSKCPSLLSHVYNNIAVVYIELDDIDQALKNLRKAEIYLNAAAKNDPIYITPYVYNNLGISYLDIDSLKESMRYEMLARAHNLTDSDNFIKAGIFRNLARLSEKLHSDREAEAYFQESISLSKRQNNFRGLGQSCLYYSLYLNDHKDYISSVEYGKIALSMYSRLGNKSEIVETTKELYKSYATLSKMGNKKNFYKDTSIHYLEMNFMYQDSITSSQKKNGITDLIVKQQINDFEQKLKDQQQQKLLNDRIDIQAIAIIIIVFIILFLLFSHSIIANQRLIRLLGSIGILVLFEFLNLLLSPFIKEKIGDSPNVMLFSSVLIAAIIAPIHHRLDFFVRIYLVKKNKVIQQQHAKEILNTKE